MFSKKKKKIFCLLHLLWNNKRGQREPLSDLKRFACSIHVFLKKCNNLLQDQNHPASTLKRSKILQMNTRNLSSSFIKTATIPIICKLAKSAKAVVFWIRNFSSKIFYFRNNSGPPSALHHHPQKRKLEKKLWLNKQQFHVVSGTSPSIFEKVRLPTSKGISLIPIHSARVHTDNTHIQTSGQQTHQKSHSLANKC